MVAGVQLCIELEGNRGVQGVPSSNLGAPTNLGCRCRQRSARQKDSLSGDRRHSRVSGRHRAPQAGRGAGPLETFATLEFGEIPIEGPERDVSALAGDLENEDIREGYTFVLAKLFNGSLDHVLVLKRQMLVAEQHLDGFGDIFAGAVVNGIEDPGRLGEHQMGYPRAFGDELLCGLDLFLVVPRDESNQDIGVNRAHVVCASVLGCFP